MGAAVVKRLPQIALAKGVIYLVVKKVAVYLGIQLTKETFAKSVGKIVPIVEGVVSGGITLGTFRPMRATLRNYLAELPMANPKAHQSGEHAASREDAAQTIEAEVIEVVEVL